MCPILERADERSAERCMIPRICSGSYLGPLSPAFPVAFVYFNRGLCARIGISQRGIYKGSVGEVSHLPAPVTIRVPTPSKLLRAV